MQPSPDVQRSRTDPKRIGASNFRSDIQGLRAIAVGLVLLYHAGVPGIPGGYVGVDVFFVISGFLISSHLLESIERDGRVSFAQFYARRARRILPASFVVAGATAVAVVAFFPPLGVERVLRDALATVLYVPNVWFAAQNTDYLADHSPSPYQHYWSLGVEEQFYLLWPVLLLVLALVAQRRRARIVGGIAVLAAVSLTACIVLTQSQQPLAFFLLPTRAWELLIGAVVAAAVLGRVPRMKPWVAAVGGWVGVAMIVAAAVRFDDTTPFPGVAAMLPVVGTAAVIFFGTARPAGGPGAALSVRPMQFIGLISYSLYLVHWPLLVVPEAAIGNGRPLELWATVVLGIVVAVPLAYLLHRFVEEPLRSPAALVRMRPRLTLLGTAAVTAIMALVVATGVGWAATRELSGGAAVAAPPSFPASPPEATRFVPSNLTPTLEKVGEDVPSLYPDGCHNDTITETVQDCVYGNPAGSYDIALFGDSHSAQWLPSLEQLAASDTEMTIKAYSKSSCPAVDVTVLVKNVPYTSCDRWREAVMAELTANPPDLVVFSSYSAYPLDGATDPGQRLSAWEDGVRQTVTSLTESGSRVVVIADTPRFAEAPSLCISMQLEDVLNCAGARSEVLDADQASAERRAVEAGGGEFADLTPFICGDGTCPVVVDNLLVYRDVNHLTAAYVRYLAPALAAYLEPAG
ncbi:acyltransferase family protein [Agromyces italicus]|uniref:acyltransferase family protein n=1 Tax=Agromyces italicus TaxID=279572 RepID=UPI0003B3DC1F|nr:acyltransferase family protein [Agromyces italicus]